MNTKQFREYVDDKFGTKDSLADFLGVSRFTVYRWYKEPGKIPVGLIVKLSKKTKTPIKAIIGNDEFTHQGAD